jgi:hypothetical protein
LHKTPTALPYSVPLRDKAHRVDKSWVDRQHVAPGNVLLRIGAFERDNRKMVACVLDSLKHSTFCARGRPRVQQIHGIEYLTIDSQGRWIPKIKRWCSRPDSTRAISLASGLRHRGRSAAISLGEAMQRSGTGAFSRPPTITMMHNECAPPGGAGLSHMSKEGEEEFFFPSCEVHFACDRFVVGMGS